MAPITGEEWRASRKPVQHDVLNVGLGFRRLGFRFPLNDEAHWLASHHLSSTELAQNCEVKKKTGMNPMLL